MQRILNELDIIENCKRLNIDLDKIKSNLSFEDIKLLLNKDLQNVDFRLPIIYQVALVKQNLFEWQKDLSKENIEILANLLSVKNDLKLSNINKTNLKLVQGSIFNSCTLLINLLQLDISEDLFFKLFNALQQFDNFDFIYSLDDIDYKNLDLLKYFEYKNEDELLSILKLLRDDDINKFLSYLITHDYISNYAGDILFIEKNMYKEKLEIMKSIETKLSTKSLVNVVNIFYKINFKYNIMEQFKVNLFELNITRCLSITEFCSILWDKKYSNVTSYIEQHPYILKLLFYCIINDKIRFLKLIDENITIIDSMDIVSCYLFNPIFWNIINLNEFNKNDLIYISTCRYRESLVNIISSKINKYITINEFKALNNWKQTNFILKIHLEKMADIYFSLNLKVDDKIIVINELKNTNNFPMILRKIEDITSLVDCLNVKKLSEWVKEFSYIKGINSEICLSILCNKSKLDKYLADMKNAYEVGFILRNDVSKYSLSEIKDNILHIDRDCIVLFELLDLPKNFMVQYADNIKKFCLNNLATISVNHYYSGRLSNEQRIKFLDIIKAELAGKLKNFKYYKNSLENEIKVYNLDNKIKSQWVYNYSHYSESKKLLVKECDDFYSIITIGINPYIFYPSYANRKYSDCLLSNFDSSKKVICVYLDSIVAGQAIIRLTKVTTNLEETNVEEPVIFLEKICIACINVEELIEIKKEVLKLVQDKANAMRIKCLIDKDYRDVLNDDYCLKNYNIFVNNSNDEKQYLESCNAVRDSGTYILEELYEYIQN